MKKNMKILTLVLTVVLVVALAVSSVACAPKTDFTVGVLQLVQHDALDAATQGFVDALNEEMAKAGKTVEIIVQNASGETANCSTIAGSFVAKGVDLIMANATPALQAVANATMTIPILGTSVTEYGVALGIDNFNGTVGGNISGTSDLAPLEDQANILVDLLPEAKTVGILYCSAEANSKYQADTIKALLESKDLTVVVKTFTDSNDIAAVLNSMVDDVDALYLPTDNVVASNATIIANICGPAKLPVFAGEEGICKVAGFATLSISYYELGKQTGKMAADILLGKANISNMPISYDPNPVKKYVKSICEDLGIEIPADFVEIVID